jgi:hypothetical protein
MSGFGLVRFAACHTSRPFARLDTLVKCPRRVPTLKLHGFTGQVTNPSAAALGLPLTLFEVSRQSFNNGDNHLSAPQVTSRPRSANRVNSGMKVISTGPVEPARCLATMISAIPFFS